MYNVLISIKPEYVEKIFDGSKKYEYRKIKAKRNFERIIIYSTYPVMKIVGEAKIEKILEDSPQNIWKETSKYSGVDMKFYDEYFRDRSTAIAYKLSNVRKYEIPKDLSDFGLKMAPQSFVYVKVEKNS